MLRLVLLLLYLTSSFLAPNKIGGGLDPNGGNLHGNLDPNGLTIQWPREGGAGNDPDGLKTQTSPTGTGEIGGGWDPDGLTAPPPPATTSGDIGGGWDPNG